MSIISNFKKNIFQNEDVFQSSKTASVAAFLLVATILTALLSVRYFLYQNNISNGIAKRTLPAKSNIEVVDKQRTEIIKREVANKIRPVVAPVESEYIKTDLNKVIDDIERIKKDKKKSYQAKQKELIDILEVNETDTESKAINYILTTSDINLTGAFTNAQYVLSELLTVGIFDSDISNFVTDSFIDKTLGSHIKRNQYPLIIALIEHSVVPNLIIDEYATEVARKNARNAVKPYIVTYKNG